MKPLLVIPPCPRRWPALRELYEHKEPIWLEDIELRALARVEGAQDAFAVVPEGRRVLAGASVHKHGAVGLLGHVFTRVEHRRRGYARGLIESLIAWFEMTGGQRLYLGTTADLATGLFERHGFRVLHRAVVSGEPRVTMLRCAAGVSEPAPDARPPRVTVRGATRADWPAMVELLQQRPGSDPRVPQAESAVLAEQTTLELLSGQQRGQCQLLLALCDDRPRGIASVATDRQGDRTFAVLMPHDAAPSALREAVLAFATSRGFRHVDYPFDALRDRGSAEGPVAPSPIGGAESDGAPAGPAPPAGVVEAPGGPGQGAGGDVSSGPVLRSGS